MGKTHDGFLLEPLSFRKEYIWQKLPAVFFSGPCGLNWLTFLSFEQLLPKWSEFIGLGHSSSEKNSKVNCTSELLATSFLDKIGPCWQERKILALDKQDFHISHSVHGNYCRAQHGWAGNLSFVYLLLNRLQTFKRQGLCLMYLLIYST